MQVGHLSLILQISRAVIQTAHNQERSVLET